MLTKARGAKGSYAGVVLASLLLGYAVAGKGFGYLGFEPLYVGELGAILTTVLLLFRLTPYSLPALAKNPPLIIVYLYVTVCLVQTVPHISNYGMLALRDAALYGYSLYAVIGCLVVLTTPGLVFVVLDKMESYATIFLALSPLAWVATNFFNRSLPLVALPDATFPSYKAGDTGVHLAAILCAMVMRVLPSRIGYWILLLISLVGISFSRSAVVSVLMAFGLLCVIWPVGRRVFLVFGLLTLSFTVAYVSDLRIDLPVIRREISARAIGGRLLSVLGDTSAAEVGVSETRVWRLMWWNKIIDYTVYGEYFWTGKGFGINLSTDDGFVVDAAQRLRSPHSAHLNILARGGVPALTLWVALLWAWMWRINRCRVSARRRGLTQWSQIFCLLMCYFTAALVNASFDVYLEGPMGGILFWSIYGFGIGCSIVYLREERTSRVTAGGASRRVGLRALALTR
jgi:hypothetical protein